MSDIALPWLAGPVPNICAVAPGAKISGAGNAEGRASSDSPVSAIHADRKMYCACRAMGPSQRSRMSIHGANLGFTRNAGSAQFWLPQ